VQSENVNFEFHPYPDNMKRKAFINRSILAIGGLSLLPKMKAYPRASSGFRSSGPMVISTWPHGVAANEAAWKVLTRGGRALDAVEKGVNVTELDPEVTSVGYGGFPDRDGIVTLDACIMDEKGDAGSVTFLQHIKTPVSVARLVMEQTPHVMLSGEGALQFALANGFKKEELLTDFARQSWENWKKSKTNIPVDQHNHDTISMLAIDKPGNLSGACTTSGTAFKYHGRVGDSPIIGAGLYVDNEIGAAGATGVGEVILKSLGSFSIVENMRHGYSPQEACEETVHRALKKVPDAKNQPIYFIALNKEGEIGAYGTNAEFKYAWYTEEKGNCLIQAGSAY
jgi:isoaspartyl peptidase/L-asparaginase-like protein (Ntn-hydrolase superfamily)